MAGKPNSLTSAPPQNVAPAPVSTTAPTEASPAARSRPSATPAAHAQAERIDGLIVERDHGDCAA